MNIPYDDDLFYTCCLIEQIGRNLRRRRGDVVSALGEKEIRGIYQSAEVLHCEPIAKVAEETIEMNGLSRGNWDNINAARYRIPSVFTVGKVYARLIEDAAQENEGTIQALFRVYCSWMDELLSDYNTDLFYQPREYLAVCFRQGRILDE